MILENLLFFEITFKKVTDNLLIDFSSIILSKTSNLSFVAIRGLFINKFKSLLSKMKFM